MVAFVVLQEQRNINLSYHSNNGLGKREGEEGRAGVVTYEYEYAPQVHSQTRLQHRQTRPTRRAAWVSRFCHQAPQRTRVDRYSAGRKYALHIQAPRIGSKRTLRCLGVELGFPGYQISIYK